MARHGFAHREIEAVEIGSPSPAGMRAQGLDRIFEVPAVDCAGNQAAEKYRRGMLRQGAAEIETGRNTESIERSFDQREIDGRLAQGDADLMKPGTLCVKVENAPGDFVCFAFERAGIDEDGLRLARIPRQEAIFRAQLKRKSADVVGCRRVGNRQRQIADLREPAQELVLDRD